MALAAAVDSPAAAVAALAAAVVPARVCLLVAFRLWFWLVWCEGRLLFAAIEGGMHAGNARLRSGCLRRSVADNGDCAADGNAGQVPIGYSAAGSRITPRSNQCRAVAPCGERLGYNGHL